VDDRARASAPPDLIPPVVLAWRNLLEGSWLNNSGSGLDGRESIILSVLVSVIWMVSSSPQATSANLPSLVTSKPHGRARTFDGLRRFELVCVDNRHRVISLIVARCNVCC